MKGYCIFGFVLIACISFEPVECMEKNDKSLPYYFSTSSSIAVASAKCILGTIKYSVGCIPFGFFSIASLPYVRAEMPGISCALEDVF